MSETAVDPGRSAGALLRAAREEQGLHIAALAASIKITPRKLEALENARFDELPDATFARARALTVCRALKLDAAPVLARLPQGGASGLAPLTGGLNTPFRDRPGSTDVHHLTLRQRPLIWAAVLVLLAAVALYLAPAGWWSPSPAAPDAMPPPSVATPAAEPAALASAPVVAADSADSAAPVAPAEAEAAASAPPAPPAPAAAAAPSVPLLALAASEATWVELVDARGQVLVSRTLQRGENVDLDGEPPLRLRIGNAAGLKLRLRGENVDLATSTVNNVARLQLN
jgi:cytoskeleton protein RodZ